MTHNIAVLPGDGIGPEIMEQALRVLTRLNEQVHDFQWQIAPIGGAAYHQCGHPLPEASLKLAEQADAVLFGAVGDPATDHLPRHLRPEQAILGLREQLQLFANLRPVKVFDPLVSSSSLKPEYVQGLDLLIVRELTGDIYFGQPRGLGTTGEGLREGYNTMRYNEAEVRRVCQVAFDAARLRGKKVCSVDKFNVLATSELWRTVATEVAADYPDVSLSHMLVDNAAMQLVRQPKAFDVIVTGNLFGDILSDEAAMLSGSIGMLASASLDARHKGLYEPIHGSAPDIAGKGLANPIAMVLSVAMMLRYSLHEAALADQVENAVHRVLNDGLRTADIAGSGPSVSTSVMGDAIVAAL